MHPDGCWPGRLCYACVRGDDAHCVPDMERETQRLAAEVSRRATLRIARPTGTAATRALAGLLASAPMVALPPAGLPPPMVEERPQG